MTQAQTELMTHGSHWRSDDEAEEESSTVVMPRVAGGSSNRPSATAKIGGLVTSSAGVWGGLLLTVAGFGAIFFAWVKVAGLLNVALQIPYVVSGGLTGLALVIAGMAVVDISVRRQDAHERRQRLAQMNRVLAELREQLESDEYYEQREQ